MVTVRLRDLILYYFPPTRMLETETTFLILTAVNNMINRTRLSFIQKNLHEQLRRKYGTYQTMTWLQKGSYPITTQCYESQGCQVKTEGPVKRPVYQVQGLSIWSYLPFWVTQPPFCGQRGARQVSDWEEWWGWQRQLSRWDLKVIRSGLPG